MARVCEIKHPIDPCADPDLGEWAHLLALIRAEIDMLEGALPAVIEARCLPSPRPKPREDTTERAKNVHSDPTLAIVLDERRMQLSQQLLRSRNVVRSVAVALRGVRRGLDLSYESWNGECDGA